MAQLENPENNDIHQFLKEHQVRNDGKYNITDRQQIDTGNSFVGNQINTIRTSGHPNHKVHLNAKEFKSLISNMNEEQLTNYQGFLNDCLDIVRKRRQELHRMEHSSLCILCSNPKDVVYIGCNHWVICSKCECQLERKQCLKCLKEYDEIIKLDL